MARYINNHSPTIRDEDGNLLVFTEVRVSLACGPCSPAMWPSSTATNVTIRNFGND
jgi:hypothetical protein